MIDWDFAVATGTKLAGRGPDVSRAEASEAVAELREGAAKSTALVSDYTGLIAPADTAPVLVVDRGGWIRANAEVFEGVISPIIAKIEGRKGPATGITKAVGSKVTGLEVGTLLGFLSSKVLGQFDPFYQDTGRLLLVAPNVVQAERQLDANARDFRLWVCLHEETHRVQFTAVPWMGAHIRGEIEGLLDTVETDPSRLADLVRDGIARMRGGAARTSTSESDGSLLELFSTPGQRAVIERITAVMSLLEGHADVVMDGVGPTVIPTVTKIRKKFDVRRKGGGPLDRAIRRLLGLDAKMAQYRNGAAFVRGVTDKVGMAGFNRVWEGADMLPTPAEISDPKLWVTRVHGA